MNRIRSYSNGQFSKSCIWMFENAFFQLTKDGHDLFNVPYGKIRTWTFESDNIFKEIETILGYPQCKFDEETERNILLSAIDVAYPAEDNPDVNNERIADILLNTVCYSDNFSYQEQELLAINNRHDLVISIAKNYKNPVQNLLLIAAEFGYKEMYFNLLDCGFRPTFNVYEKAVIGKCLDIVKHVSLTIEITVPAVKAAFEFNNTEIILFVIDEIKGTKIHISNETTMYPIVNKNIPVIEAMIKNNLFKWKHNVLHSAILSGSFEMVKYCESHMATVHNDKQLDYGKNSKGKSSHITPDTVYSFNGKNYFSHTVNYAVQSRNLEIFNHIISLGYGLSLSNFITAIRYSTPEILEELCNYQITKLPFYINYLFTPFINIVDKEIKLKILMKHNLIDIHPPSNLSDINRDTSQLCVMLEDKMMPMGSEYDPDFLFSHHIFHPVPKSTGVYNYKLAAQTWIAIKTDQYWDIVFNTLNIKDKSQSDNCNMVADFIALYGTVNQLAKFTTTVRISGHHNIQVNLGVILQLLVYNKIGKISAIFQRSLYLDTVDPIWVIAKQMDNPLMLSILEKLLK